MADFSTVLVRTSPQIVQVNSAVPGSYDNVGRLSFGYLSVKEYGAKGDGTTDDTTAIQNCVTAAVAAGLDVLFPKTSTYYKVTGRITVTGRCNLLGNALITTTSTTQEVFKVTGSNVSFQEGLRLSGPSTHTSIQSTGKGIYVLGTSAASPATNILIRDVEVSGFNLYGVALEWVDGFEVRSTKVGEIANAGIICISALNGRIHHNSVDSIGNAVDTYGITCTRRETNSLTTEPRSTNILVDHNEVSNVLLWEALDTHGGERISFLGNLITNCHIGVNVGATDNASNTPTWAPIDCTAISNQMNSGVADGTAGVGIYFTGIAGTGATGAIRGNTVRRYGNDVAGLTNGAITLFDTAGVAVQENTLIESSPAAVVFYHDNTGCRAEGNIAIDVWSEASTVPNVVEVNSTNNVVTITGNTLLAGSKSATHLNVGGSRIDATTGNAITYGPNDFTAATSPYTNAGTSELLGPGSVKRASVGDTGVTLQAGVNSETQCYATVLTQNRAVTLSTTGAYDGARFTIVRTGLGNFTLDVGGLKTIPSATAATVKVVFRAGAWQLESYSLL